MVFKKIEPHRMVFQPWVSHSACWISPNTMIWGISYFSPLMVRMSGSFLVSPGHFFPHFSCFAALSRRLIPFVQGNVNTFRHINNFGPSSFLVHNLFQSPGIHRAISVENTRLLISCVLSTMFKSLMQRTSSIFKNEPRDFSLLFSISWKLLLFFLILQVIVSLYS